MNTENQNLQKFNSQAEQRQLFDSLASDVITLCLSLGLTNNERILDYLSRFWLPLALELAILKQQTKKTLVLGILGGQGMGKTTLCVILKYILNRLDYSVANLSLDDLYLSYEARQKLKQEDPRLIWRGPPGTHDIDLGLQVIEQCCQDKAETIKIPRFDKSAFNGAGDRSTPEIIIKPDILLFEGWFVGVQPIEESCFDRPPAPIVSPEDIQFAKDNNQRLQAYLPLWSKLDRLIVLYPEDYRLSKQWRKDAERKAIAAGKTGMDEAEIERFVEYFWQALHPELFIKPITNTADLVVELKSDRTLSKIMGSKNLKLFTDVTQS